MKYAIFLLIGIVSFFIIEVLSINIPIILGYGSTYIESIATSITLLSTIIIVCTVIIVDTIKNNKM
ncbi:hypothetical protein [Clostridium celatum]|uniref:hypothetical protein n=1 Tax=Clostridium celatum TaxID=36834 RepID=UPI001897AFE6|nr:hypothetical protein [Clostridium celatum]